MALSETQMSHPQFMRFSGIANDTLASALKRAGLGPDKLASIDVHAGRVVDEITALLIRVERMK